MKKAEKKLATVRTRYGLFQCVFEPEQDMGGYTVVAPKVRGAVSWGSTLVEAKRMIAEAIEGVYESQIIMDAAKIGTVRLTRMKTGSILAV